MGAQVPVPSGYFNQTYTVEFDVPGDLDGSTIVPQNITVPAENEDPQQIYRPDVEDDAGLFDVDYVVREGPEQRGVAAFRVIHQVWIFSPVVGGADAAIEIVDAVDGPIIVQSTVDSLVGEQTFFRDRPFLVPQGSLIRIRGFSNPSGVPIRVRMSVQFTNDLVAAQQAVCSCGNAEVSTDGGGGGGGTGEVTIQSNGVDVATTSIINFTGQVTPVDGGTRVDVAVPGVTYQWFGFNLTSTGPLYLNVACGVAVAASPTGNVGTSLLMPFDGELLRVDMRSYAANYGSSVLDAYIDAVLIDSDTQDLNTGGFVTFTFSGVNFVRGEHIRLRLTTTINGGGVSACMVFRPNS